jgi:hypothetical protein
VLQRRARVSRLLSESFVEEASRVYCPHCGREMTLLDGVFTCVAGGMPLSPHMQAVLTERFPEPRPRPSGVELGRRLTRWFCPGCGLPLGPEMRCSRCGRSLRDQLFGLVELHPHGNV